MSPLTSDPVRSTDPRAGCRGVSPLTARLEPWQQTLCRQPEQVAGWLEQYGSPLNVLDPSPMARNANELREAAKAADVDLRIFFARKANKALALVDKALDLGLGIDVASEQELHQTLLRGAKACDIMVTAAVKPQALMDASVACGATVVIDNEDELELLIASADRAARSVPVALRIAPRLSEGRPPTRFGFDADEVMDVLDRHRLSGGATPATIVGVHFHVHGYDVADRVAALQQSLGMIDALRAAGHRPTFVDIGGGIAMSYLDDGGEWTAFWREHRAALLGKRTPLTFQGHGLGLLAHAGEIFGEPNVYPAYQRPTRATWLAQILGATLSATTVAGALRARGLQLRCEPGRSLVDGCGLTAARVEFRKHRHDGTWLIGVAMNRTQCRSTAEDFLLDPLLLRPDRASSPAPSRPTGAIEGYLVGAYCVERELLTWRRMRFPGGVEIGDIVVFPNTAGYMMHILESPSHQIPLARNLIVSDEAAPVLDAIDR